MYTTHLRKVGGSVMLSIPPAILEMLRLKPGAIVDVGLEGNRLIVQANQKARYTLDELLAQCDSSKPLSTEDRHWLADTATGREIL